MNDRTPRLPTGEYFREVGERVALYDPDRRLLALASRDDWLAALDASTAHPERGRSEPSTEVTPQ
jgi:hypothetical protein